MSRVRWIVALGASALAASCTLVAGIESFSPAAPDATAPPTPDAGDVVALDASDAAIEAEVGVPCLDLARIEPTTPAECSISSVDEGKLHVRSDCSEPIDVMWLDFGCAEFRYGTLTTGQERTFGTFATHYWRIRLADGGLVLKELGQVDAGDTRATVP